MTSSERSRFWTGESFVQKVEVGRNSFPRQETKKLKLNPAKRPRPTSYAEAASTEAPKAELVIITAPAFISRGQTGVVTPYNRMGTHFHAKTSVAGWFASPPLCKSEGGGVDCQGMFGLRSTESGKTHGYVREERTQDGSFWHSSAVRIQRRQSAHRGLPKEGQSIGKSGTMIYAITIPLFNRKMQRSWL